MRTPQLVTYRTLFTEPLWVLFERCVALRGEELRASIADFSWYHWLRYPRLARRMLVKSQQGPMLAFAPGDLAGRARAVFALRGFTRMMDHYIDPDDPHPDRPWSAQDYFLEATGLIYALSDPEEIYNEYALPEMALLVYAWRYCNVKLGFDPTLEMRTIWAKYSPDAIRTYNGDVLADAETIKQAFDSYLDIIALTLVIYGLPRWAARFASRLLAPMQYLNVLNEFSYDLAAGNVQVPIEELVEAGVLQIGEDGNVTPESYYPLRACVDWEDLAEIDGFAQWFLAAVDRAQTQWVQNRGEVEELYQRFLPSRIIRYFGRRTWHRAERRYEELGKMYLIEYDEEPAASRSAA